MDIGQANLSTLNVKIIEKEETVKEKQRKRSRIRKGEAEMRKTATEKEVGGREGAIESLS